MYTYVYVYGQHTTDSAGHTITELISSSVNPCEVGQTPCYSGQCIPSEDVCNGQDDCGDGSDEEGCCMYSTCTITQFVNSSPLTWMFILFHSDCLPTLS